MWGRLWAIFALSCYTISSAQVRGSFRVLSYNIAGLPELLSSGKPSRNTPLIGARLGPYDVINVQEDFNYHAALYAANNHPYRTPTSGGAGFGSGLNTLSNYPYIDLECVTWKDCNLNSGDCITPKGFTFKRVRVSEGFYLDVYNLHTDAGSDSGDISARSKNFAQLTSFIASWSAGMPVVAMGDTNARYTRSGDSETLRTFLSNTETTDSWIESVRGGSYPEVGSESLACPYPFPAGTLKSAQSICEPVDKIFIRSSPLVTITSTYSNDNDAFLDSDNLPLSDHYPITNTISWQLSSVIRLGDPAGGPHGSPFNDIATTLSSGISQITSITIRGGNRVDGVSYTARYTNRNTITSARGGSGGTPSTLTLNAGERVVQFQACSGKHNDRTRVFYLSLTTNLGRIVQGGKAIADCVVSGVPGNGGNWGLFAFWGRHGDEIDRLGAIWGAAY
ncbi:hypothetical protein AX16_006677 [Volvariella volvacea WC 439]|nr:hypothetical protein AX16_006677 [Volvariella volvacea WC 439]